MEKVVTIKNIHDSSTDFLFWMSKTPKERLAAIEFLRQQYINYTHASQRLQRVCNIITKA
jgi:hypothetical protein